MKGLYIFSSFKDFMKAHNYHMYAISVQFVYLNISKKL